jgi:hypothetical protein
MNPHPLSRRAATRWLCAAAAGIAAPAVLRAQADPRSFTVVSEMARELVFVTHEPQIGTTINTNQVQRFPIAEGRIELMALRATRQAIRDRLPVSAVALVAPLAEDLMPPMQAVAVGDAVALSAELREVLREHRSTELLAWTRERSPTRIRFLDAVDAGKGQLEGLGMYVDRELNVITRGQRTIGFIAPYLHARATLIDIKTARVLRTERVQRAEVFTNLRTDVSSAQAWDALSTEGKVIAITQLMTDQIKLTVDALLA